MSAIHRYIFGQLTTVAIFVIVVLTAVVWLSQSLRFMDFIVNRGLPLTDFILFVAFLIPGFLGLVIPIAVFAAILFVYNKLHGESELVVLRAAGMSHLQLAWPAIRLALAATVLVYAVSLYLLPLSYHAFKNLQYEIRNDHASVLLEAGAFTEITDDLTVYVRERSGGGQLRGILVHDTRGKGAAVTMMARRGSLVRQDGRLRVILADGNRQVVDTASRQLSTLYFARYTLDLHDLGGTAAGRWRQPRERYLSGLLNPGPGPDDQRFRKDLIAEGHRRITFPLYTLGYAGIAVLAVLGKAAVRGSGNRRIAAAVGTVAGLQALQMTLTDLSVSELRLVPLSYALAAGAAIIPYIAVARLAPRHAPRLTVFQRARGST